MADIYSAELNPGKLDAISIWLKEQDWAKDVDLDRSPLEAVSSYRFDDPNGEVGVEIHIVASGDRVFQVPVTYRGAPLEGAEDFFLSEMTHSILGRRWVYAGIGDPVFQQCLDATITSAESSAVQYQVDDDGRRVEEITEVAQVVGTGHLAGAPAVEVVDELDVHEAVDTSKRGLLLGTWAGQESPVVLARMV